MAIVDRFKHALVGAHEHPIAHAVRDQPADALSWLEACRMASSVRHHADDADHVVVAASAQRDAFDPDLAGVRGHRLRRARDGGVTALAPEEFHAAVCRNGSGAGRFLQQGAADKARRVAGG